MFYLIYIFAINLFIIQSLLNKCTKRPENKVLNTDMLGDKTYLLPYHTGVVGLD